MNPEWLLPLSAVAPIVIALSGWLGPLRPALPFLTPVGLVPALAAAAWLPDGAAFSFQKGHLETAWLLDPASRTVLWFTALGWLLAACAGVGYFRRHPRRVSFSAVFLIAMGGNLLLVLAADAVTFYTGFALMSFASWALVVFDANDPAFFAGRVYLGLVLLGEIMVFPGLVKGAVLADSTLLADIQARWGTDPASAVAIWLLFLGFGIKAGMAPFHFWLPVAHPAAPTPASAVLSGCMIKAGVVGWIRLLPTGGPLAEPLAVAAVCLGAVNLLGGGVAGLLQTHPKALLAYTSIQASGTLLLGLALTLFEPSLRPAGVGMMLGYAAFHALHKASLFLAVAVSPGVTGPWKRRLAWLVLLALAASYAGVPGLAGDLAKQAAKPLFAATEPLSVLLPYLLAAGGFLTLLTTARVVALIRPGSSAHAPHPVTWLSWLVGACLAVLWPFAVQGAPFVVTDDPFTWAPFGVACYLILCWLVRRWPLPVAMPPGDVLHLATKTGVRPPPDLGLRPLQWEAALSGPAGAAALLLLLLVMLGLLSRAILF